MSGSVLSKGWSLWAKLLLIGAVILAAFLYLRSAGRSGTEVQQPETTEASGEQAVRSEADASLPAQARTASGVKGTESEMPAAADIEVDATQGSTDQAGVEVLADSDKPSPQAPESAADQTVEGARVEPELPGAATATAAEHPVAETPIVFEEERPVELRPAEAGATAGSVIGEGMGDIARDTPAAEADAIPAPSAASQDTDGDSASGLSPPLAVPAVSAPPEQKPMIDPTQDAARKNLEERRERVMSEYEAMRKRAEEEMRTHGGQGGMRVPYGYPGYGPGYYPPPR